MKSRKIELVQGAGTFVAPNAIDVDGERYVGRHVVLATGSYARSLPDLEIGGRIITSDQALTLEEVPKKVVVLGGGVIGVEFASVWRSFGADVTVVEALPRLVPQRGRLRLQAARARLPQAQDRLQDRRPVHRRQAGRQRCDRQLESGEEIEADLLLVAVGRGPNTTGHGYEEAGVTMERGFVLTDERLHTNLENVYAVGDIVPGLQLAHRGFAQGIFVAEDIAGLNPPPIDEAGIPRVTYCEPEVASVGLTEEQAREKHGEIQTLTYDLGGNGKSQILQTSGAIKLVKAGAEGGTPGPVVGLHMVAPASASSSARRS